MEKRLILAIALSLLVVLSWSALVSKTYHIDNKGVTTQEIAPVNTESRQVAIPLVAPVVAPETPSLPLLQYDKEKFEITFIESLAAIKEIKFLAHQDYIFPLKYGFLLGDKSLVFSKESSTPEAVTFVQRDSNKRIEKKYVFSNSSYGILLQLTVQNLTNAPLNLSLPLVLGVLDFSTNNKQSRYQDVVVATKEKTSHLNAQKNLQFQDVKFVGLRDRYFCAIVEPTPSNFGGFINKIGPQESEIGLSSQDLIIAPGQQLVQKFHIYLGPQELQTINSIQPEWSAVIYYGAFDFIAQILLQLLNFLYSLVHNWGWAIVLLSLLVYFILYPLTLKQMRSMKEMQVLQPRIEALRNTYKDNPQKLNKEIMELYREHKVNPFGGCLPLLLQMPIFFALYQALMRSVALKGASFLWIKDLSEPDHLFNLPFSKPFNSFNLLPILMTIGMFVQQKISAVSTSGTTAEQQKIMMIIFPLMFGFIFYSMPSGLVLYWFINSTVMLVYQFRANRKK
jgi:YidC/Oxa1 family membrane protein insertase